jgi:uncharacterized secreted protein with C-terminal beta-propeller domain
MAAPTATDSAVKVKEVAPVAVVPEAAQREAGVADTAEADYSATNVQVAGVDEADRIKTDGHYIYRISDNKLTIIQAVPAAAMRVMSTTSFAEEDFIPQEIYVDGDTLTVIGSSWWGEAGPLAQAKNKRLATDMLYPYYSRQSTQLRVFDLSDRTAPKAVRDFKLDGSYLSSRKIGDEVYIVANRNVAREEVNEGGFVPLYRDGAMEQPVDYSRIWYDPETVYPNYVLLASVNVKDTERPAQTEAYLGSGDHIYSSTENLYIAVTQWSDSQTRLYKFGVANGDFTFAGRGEVPGTVLNQFSMDEHEGRLRVATTSGSAWASGENTSKNNLYVMDADLQVVGRLEGIAPGETIYSARFMQNRAYMVTFRTVDPFFVIDLSQPTEPRLLGQLKIPGYSDYLHPYDDTHVIGFGKETIELKNGMEDSQAYYLGMKLSLFDVTDVEHPRETFKTTIGDRGTNSELLNDPKALLFSREKGLLAFPVTVMELQGQPAVEDNRGYAHPNYGTFSFQGGYVYSVDLQNGFTLKGRTTHISASEYKNAGDYWYDSEKNIDRLLYIGNTLYSSSPGYLSANDISDLRELGRISLP